MTMGVEPVTPSRGMSPIQVPKVYYRDDLITIMDKIVNLRSASYSVVNMTSVYTGYITPNYFSITLTGFVLGALVTIPLVLLGLVLRQPLAAIILPLIGGIIGAAIAVMRAKPHYVFRFKLSSGEVDMIFSKDDHYIRMLSNVLIQAMAENQ